MRTRPLTLVAVGLVLASVDARVVAFDVLPDLLGWALVSLGCWRLHLRLASALAAVAAVMAVGELVLPHRYDSLDPISGEVVPRSRVVPGTAFDERLAFDDLGGERLLLLLGALALGGAAMWLLLGVLGQRAALLGDHTAALRLRVARWALVGVWVAPQLGVCLVQAADDGEADIVWNESLELLAVAGLVSVLGTALLLMANSNRGWTATDEERLAPWGELMVRGLPGEQPG